MQIQKEKAHLAVEILTQFAPAMDQSTSLFNKRLDLSDRFTRLTETFSSLPEEQLRDFMSFMQEFTEYLNDSTAASLSLSQFQQYLSHKAGVLVGEFNAAAKVY